MPHPTIYPTLEHRRLIILDVDGTLVHSNDAHTRAWLAALDAHGCGTSYETVRRMIGMGSDHLLPSLLGISAESDEGKAISEARGKYFTENELEGIIPIDGAREFVEALLAAEFSIVIGSSAEESELKSLLKIAKVDDLISEWVSSGEVSKSKPSPDIVQAALRRGRAHPSEAVMIGDTPYDVEAAMAAGVPTIAVLTGGWADRALLNSGAVSVAATLHEITEAAQAIARMRQQA